MRKTLLATLVSLLVAGCMVGPDYVRPPVDAPAAWRLTEPEAKDLANTAWWEQFGDPVLNELVATALRENKDLTDRHGAHRRICRQIRLRPFRPLPAGRCGLRGKPPAERSVRCGRRRANETYNSYSAVLNAELGDRHLGPHPPPDRSGECANCSPARRAATASSCRWSAAWPAPTSTCATWTASWRSPRRRRRAAASRTNCSSCVLKAGSSRCSS